jgi:hypothetical protein
MKTLTVNTNDARAAFNRVRKLMKYQNPDVDFIINQDTLRIEQVLEASKNSYTFDFSENRGADRKMERKLNRNDLFFITHLAVCIAQQDASNGNYANYVLHTFPDPQIFVGDDSTNLKEYLALETIYGGRLSIKTTPVERLTDFLAHNFRYVPERGVIKKTATQNNDEPAQYGPSLEEKGFFALTPNIIIDGQENNTASLTLGSGDTTLIAGGVDASNDAVDTSNVLVLLAHGFKVVNGAKKVGLWTAN